MVKKKGPGNRYRMTIDFREVNKKIKPNRHPIPRCREMFDELRHCKYFSTFDLGAGYWNIRLDEKSRDKTSFTVGEKQYRWIALPMGLSISGNIFQPIMAEIIGTDIDQGIACYLDDVICYAPTEEENNYSLKLANLHYFSIDMAYKQRFWL